MSITSPLLGHSDQPSRSVSAPRARVRAGSMLRVPIHNSQGLLGISEVIDTPALLSWMLKDVLLKRIDAEIDSESDDAAALTPEARAKAITEIQGDLLAVERDECALVFRAQSENLPVEHRADISPLALLGVVLVTAPAVPPGTSPGTSYQARRAEPDRASRRLPAKVCSGMHGRARCATMPAACDQQAGRCRTSGTTRIKPDSRDRSAGRI